MGFIKAFHIDCGRKYFSKAELSRMIRKLGENHYQVIELAFANGGMRFFLDDMTIRTREHCYSSDQVKAALHAGNAAYCKDRVMELTEQEMTELIREAEKAGITVMPLLNTPGHMDAIMTAMEELGIREARYRGSATTVDLDHQEGCAFVEALLDKYIHWFADCGSRYFNIGCDEYANDVLASGFASLCDPAHFQYDTFIAYVNRIAKVILSAGMEPVMFNDGMYYDGGEAGGLLDQRIVCSYWSTGWPGYQLAPASRIERHGHPILNTASSWYYVLGRRNSEERKMIFTDHMALEGIQTVSMQAVPGGSNGSPIGAMLCVWCDEPYVSYTEEEEAILGGLIEAFGQSTV